MDVFSCDYHRAHRTADSGTIPNDELKDQIKVVRKSKTPMLVLTQMIGLVEKLAPAAKNAILRIFCAYPKFRGDDSVQHLRGGPLMVAESVTFRIKDPCLVSNIWFDKESNSSRIQPFAEDELRFYDWNNPINQYSPSIPMVIFAVASRIVSMYASPV